MCIPRPSLGITVNPGFSTLARENFDAINPQPSSNIEPQQNLSTTSIYRDVRFNTQAISIEHTKNKLVPARLPPTLPEELARAVFIEEL